MKIIHTTEMFDCWFAGLRGKRAVRLTSKLRLNWHGNCRRGHHGSHKAAQVG
jgi:hypothetical protein